MLTNKRRIFKYRLSRDRKSVECAFGILNAKFKISEGLMCCKAETVNPVIKASVVLHNVIRTRGGRFCEGAENYAINQLSHHISKDDDDDDNDDGRQRLSRALRLRKQLADYFLTPPEAIPTQWSYIK
jgi:hypothetical protein